LDIVEQQIERFFSIPELKIGLDAGGCRGRQPPYVFLTHSHTDHSCDIPYLYSRKEGATIYCPKENVDYLNNYIRSEIELNACDKIKEELLPPSQLIPVDAGDNVHFGTKSNPNQYRVHVIKCIHAVPCVGYLFSEKLSKLKEQYKNLTGKDLGALRKEGVEISDEFYRPLFGYIGDSHYTVLENNPIIFEYPVIIVECTFIDGETVDRANRDGHIHWTQLEPIVVSHPNNTFVLIHFSCRYKESEIHQFFDGLVVREENPISLHNVVIFMGDMGEGQTYE